MFDFHEKRRIKSVLYSKTTFVLLVMVAILLLTSVYNRLIVAQETKTKLEERKEDLEALEMRAEVLRAKVEYLENERGIEEELRNRFDVAKEGERVVIILEDKEEKKDKKAPTAENSLDAEDSAFEAILNLLKFW